MTDQHAISSAIIRLMQGVVYRESDEDSYLTLQRTPGPVRDHFAQIGVDVVIDDAEGYAYLRSRPEVEGEPPLPRLIKRRALSYNVSLMVVLLRKRLVEFETADGGGRLVLTTENIVDMMRVFGYESTNEVKTVDQIEQTIKKVADLKFVKQVRGQPGHWEVRRIIKAYVDAQTLADFDVKLQEYVGTDGADE